MDQLLQTKIAVVGLGYVGLPLAVEFGKKITTVGFDLKNERIAALKAGTDTTMEVDREELIKAEKLQFTSLPQEIADCNVFIVAVPTPIDNAKRPDLYYLESASEIVGRVLKKDDYVIYESTVYPGATEEVCVPILEELSGLKLNEDFFCGYSPERINPGDKEHRLPNIVKITSGSNPESAEFIDLLYKSIITAGTFKASSIKVAEAAKVIENTQRDVNIALINELSLIFNKLNINTAEVLQAAGTKWNFLPFRPGLVGGHCIGVDPYYLTHKAKQVGYHPNMILAGRRLNDGMGQYIASRMIKLMVNKGIDVSKSNVLIMGITFKENCPDLRNTKVIDIINELKEYNINISVHDPWVSGEEAYDEYGITMVDTPDKGFFDGVVLAVAHNQFVALSLDGIKSFCKEKCVIFDVKNIFPPEQVDGCL
ncbi:MAG: Vi polysaccharide biosynthesis UDP-N-acetylglucosamine C-6 dehydrogenase TviB [Desulfopila sp.]|jgi:UDP-N-acetyl-D-galactosamine dehydrogenase|nr:Vi polysaccharide biosynthesis UDP-N-acetylglucosamine C-6 dehydrogenase TviB [Desulfopila sp.]